MKDNICLGCGHSLRHVFADLGNTPLSNSYLKREDLRQMEPYYPLCAYVCETCLLVQVEEFESPDRLFSDYAYFSSYSTSWLKHAENYANMAARRFALNASSLVVEIASNDGYLLQYFRKQRIPILGIEPAANVAEVAKNNGIPTLVKFFGTRTAQELVQEGTSADLIIGNNVIGHVPALNDFTAGLKILLKNDGVITLEFPHLMRLMEGNQFDTIYHEHFSYFSLYAFENVMDRHGLAVFDVNELPTHGGSLRVYVKHKEDNSKSLGPTLFEVRAREKSMGLEKLETYTAFQAKVDKVKRDLLKFLIEAKETGKTVVGYGAPAKGNTLLNFCGVRKDLLQYTVDRSPHKQNHFLPGTHIPIFSPETIEHTKPDYVLILPWNLKHEIADQMSVVRSWGGQFVLPIPRLEFF
jgi:2-polyprenyl-3-methyl-5-hydroxy-6-metoxy-1,4-benzoquinol methylase